MSCGTCKHWKRIENPYLTNDRGECVWDDQRRPFWAIGVLTGADVGDSCECYERD